MPKVKFIAAGTAHTAEQAFPNQVKQLTDLQDYDNGRAQIGKDKDGNYVVLINGPGSYDAKSETVHGYEHGNKAKPVMVNPFSDPELSSNRDLTSSVVQLMEGMIHGNNIGGMEKNAALSVEIYEHMRAKGILKPEDKVSFEGWSRDGVSSLIAANTIADKYQKDVDVIAYDPVPGPTNSYLAKIPLSTRVKATIVYEAHEAKEMFIPASIESQKPENLTVIINTEGKHSSTALGAQEVRDDIRKIHEAKYTVEPPKGILATVASYIPFLKHEPAPQPNVYILSNEEGEKPQIKSTSLEEASKFLDQRLKHEEQHKVEQLEQKMQEITITDPSSLNGPSPIQGNDIASPKRLEQIKKTIAGLMPTISNSYTEILARAEGARKKVVNSLDYNPSNTNDETESNNSSYQSLWQAPEKTPTVENNSKVTNDANQTAEQTTQKTLDPEATQEKQFQNSSMTMFY